jgi:hypothetical protein
VIRYNARQWGLKPLPLDLGVTPRAVAIVTLKGRTVAPVAALFMQQVREAAQKISSAANPRRAA